MRKRYGSIRLLRSTGLCCGLVIGGLALFGIVCTRSARTYWDYGIGSCHIAAARGQFWCSWGSDARKELWLTEAIARLDRISVWPRYTTVRPGLSRVVVPLWIPLIVGATLIFLPCVARTKGGLGGCHNCGYDLTGNVSGKCPECGQATVEGWAMKEGEL